MLPKLITSTDNKSPGSTVVAGSKEKPKWLIRYFQSLETDYIEDAGTVPSHSQLTPFPSLVLLLQSLMGLFLSEWPRT